MLYVYVAPECERDAATINTKNDIETLRDKLIYEQSTLGLERHPFPFLKKRIGRTRVVMAEVMAGEDLVLCFLRHVYKKDIGQDYKAFFETLRIPDESDPDFRQFLKNARATPVVKKAQASELETEYLVLDRAQEFGDVTVLESPIWVSAMRAFRETSGKQGLLTPIWELLQEVCEDRSENWPERYERESQRYGVCVLYRHFPESNQLYLISPLDMSGANKETNAAEAKQLLEDSHNFGDEELLRNAARAYPDFVVYDREVWESTQASVDANLALSPEESDVLAEVLDPTRGSGFPLFINGRPGSGKSTILQYLFAEYLHSHLARPENHRLPFPPLYLTYNERLLDSARNVVADIFHSGAAKLAQTETVGLSESAQKAEFDKAFVYFREFLRDLADTDKFELGKYVDYYRFRSLYSANASYGPDARLRQLAPEVAWHTLRTYIKGKNAGESEYFDPESYAELPRDEITVTPETFELVWDKVWNGWYRSLCEKEGYWDDQDLARFLLDNERVPSRYPGVFCDESQDFTSIELELIFRLSLYSTKSLPSYFLTKVPYAFAGDPFQTLNPTGFRWDAIKANFHDNISRQLAPDSHGKVNFTFKELAYNYRSTGNIVRFCNLIQLKRAELFGIPDVMPQRAWTVEKGTWPAYFELNLGTEGQLKDQTELVIIVPCQEGEEESFIKGDRFLKRIALSDSGQISRSVLSPMRAKGLEFSRVVLYKFGAQALREGHTGLMSDLSSDEKRTAPREQTLGLEYFFNGLYVAASRAQRRLLVVDTAEGLNEFWDFAASPESIGGLLAERRGTHWREDDVHHMMRGDASTWSEGRDDPRALADRFFEQGRLDQSTYLLQLARNQYAALEERDREERCNALIHELNGDHLSAATAYANLGELPEAIRCYWNAKAFDEVSEIAAKDPGRFGHSPFVIAARFMSGQRTAVRATQFIRDLTEVDQEGRRMQFRADHWSEVVQTAVETLCQEAESGQREAHSFGEVFRSITKMSEVDGLAIENSVDFAMLAYEAGEPLTALEVWKEIKRRGSDREPEFILRARAMSTPYPQRLRWYGQLGDFDRAIAEYKENQTVDLDRDLRYVVMQGLMGQKDFPTAVTLLKAGAEREDIRDFLMDLPSSEAGRKASISLLGALIKNGLALGEFRQVIDDFKPGKAPIPAIAVLLEDEEILLRCDAALVKLLARNKKLVEEKRDEKFISGTLLNIARKRGERLRSLVSVEEMGAALERAGRMDHALSFYELVFKERLWGGDRETEQKAKVRWLKCKEKQAELSDRDARRKNQRRAEAKRMSVEWGLAIPVETFPVLRELGPHEIDVLFEKQARGLGGEPRGLPVESPRAGHGQTTGALSAVEFAETVPATLPAREPREGQIELACTCDGLSLEGLLLPRKRRLDLRNRADGDLVMIRAGDGRVEGVDVDVTALEGRSWRVGGWAIDVMLLKLSGELTLVDVTGKDGRRVLCVAL